MIFIQKPNHILLLSLSLLLQIIASTSSKQRPQNKNKHKSKIKGISYKKFLSILHTESNKEFYLNSTSEIESIWETHIDFEWNRISGSEDTAKLYPFVVCSENHPEEEDVVSSSQRHARLKQHIETTSSSSTTSKEKPKAYMIPFYVTMHETCYTLYTTLENAQDIYHKYQSSSSQLNHHKKEMVLKMQPFSYSMKILSGSIDLVDVLWNDVLKKEQELTNENVEDMAFFMDEMLLGTKKDMSPIFHDIIPQRRDKSNQSNKKNVKPALLTIDVALCPSKYNKEDLNKTIRTKILESAMDNSKLKKRFFWSHLDSPQRSQRAIFWEGLLSSSNEVRSVCRSTWNDISIALEDSIQVPFQEEEEVTMPILKITFPNTSSADKSCIYRMILSLSLLSPVCTIQTQSTMQTYNHNVQWLVQTGVQDVTPWYDVGLDGSDQVIGNSDTGVDLDHCYFKDNESKNLKYGGPETLDLTQRKIVQYDDYVDREDYTYGHGTHVVGSLIGDKIDGTTTDPGIAPNAKVAFIDIGTDDGALKIPSISRLLATGSPHAKIHSASWGNGYNGYGLYSMKFDSYVFSTDDELLPILAAGNSGSQGDHTTCEPSNGKNVMSVGSSHSYSNDLQEDMKGPGYISYFSSRGPTLDGRRKPDVIAPGHYVSSAAADGTGSGCDPPNGKSPDPNHATEGLVSFSGTSMSTPMVASTAALIRQYLREGYYPTGTKHSGDAMPNPSAALVKGLLMNGAQYLFGVEEHDGNVKEVHPYDNVQNFGRVSLVDSLYLVNQSNVQVVLWDREEIASEANATTYTVKIDTSGGCTNTKLSVTLTYTDPPGQSGCEHCLIHDLDLLVTPNGDSTTKYYPNGNTQPDRSNNVERVIVDNVIHGASYDIVLSAYALIEPQLYALVASGCFGGTGNSIDMSKTVYVQEEDDEKRTYYIWLIYLPGLLAGCGCCYVIKRQQSIENEIRDQGDIVVVTTMPSDYYDAQVQEEPLILNGAYN